MPFDADNIFDDDASSNDRMRIAHHHVRDDVWIDELKRPVAAAPDFSHDVLSRLGKAMPGVSGQQNRQQTWVWRMGLIAALVVLSCVGVWSQTLQQRQFDKTQMITAADLAEFDVRVADAVRPTISIFDQWALSAKTVADHMNVSDDMRQTTYISNAAPVSTNAVMHQRIFPVSASPYWSQRSGNQHRDLLDPFPSHGFGHKSARPTMGGIRPLSSSADESEWEETHADEFDNADDGPSFSTQDEAPIH